MSGVRPIEMNIQAALCEQAPTVILYIHFCMAELLFTVYHNFCASSIMQNHKRQTLLSAQLSQTANHFTEIQSLINLFQALGGGQN